MEKTEPSKDKVTETTTSDDTDIMQNGNGTTAEEAPVEEETT
ncbi:hypothetical protein NP493_207g02018 [Ridgeia piscesae]|uniref:Uncharacterized protein n=1 Tax=Ridgeia piscesae TaxID=27915 RepID=A0AAD9P150_RIDPI|nr:hypothetical protein NP493_207g02018 [Ridgeia piscesae]